MACKIKIVVLVGTILMLFTSCSKRVSETGKDTRLTASTMEEMTLYVGTYTEKEAHVNGKAEGIYVYKFNAKTGKLSYLSTSPRVINPSYLAIHPSKEYLYAVNETGGREPGTSGGVSAFRIDPKTSDLSLINQVSSAGDWPCYISVDYSGRFALVANYSGSVVMLPLNKDGSIGQASKTIQHRGGGPTNRQRGPHAHMIIPGFDNELAYAVDLGADKVFTYVLDTDNQTLVPTQYNTDITAGAGPRQMVLHPLMKTAYVVNEINGTVECFNIAESGKLERFQTISTLPDGVTADAASADIQIHPSGLYLYVSNRGENNNLAIYEISSQNGTLHLLAHQTTYGKGPRSFVIDPSGSFLIVANQDTDNMFTFKIDNSTGLLIDDPIETQTPTPVCLKFL
jgi:6-phosphogluconolactonase